MRPFKYIAVAAGMALVFGACKSPKKLADAVAKIELKNDPEVLEVRGDSVLINVRGKFPPKTFAKNALVKFQPVMRFGSEEQPLKPLYLIGEKAKHDGAVKIDYKEGGTFYYTDKFPYKPEMRNSVLSLDYTVKFNYKYEDLQQCISDTKDSAVRGTIATALTVQSTDDIYYYDNYAPTGGFRKLTFYYVINEGKLRDSVMRGPTVNQLRTLAKDTNFTFQLITLNSYASPDGEMARNVTLTKERAESSYKLVKKELLKLGRKQLNDSNLVRRPDVNGEDWEGLRRMVTASNIDGKDEVLNIINSNLSVRDKEAALRKHSSWRTLTTTILPRLRRTEVVFAGSFPNRSYQTASMMANSNIDQLTKKEMIMVANQTTDTAMQAKIYRHYMQKYPDDWAGANNYAVMLLNESRAEVHKDPMGMPTKAAHAENILQELSARFPGNDTIINNLGVAKRYLHKYDDAKNLYETAQRDGMNMNNNLGILYIKYGDYEKSASTFDANVCSYNTALAHTLKGDYETALQKIECIDDKTAEDYYLRAVVAARKGDKDLMTTSLTRAIQEDPSLHDMAKTDLEFRRYNRSQEFMNSIRVENRD